MANERTYPLLPCADIDESIAFYESLGFKATYRQVRPNPSAVVAREDLHIHLFGIDGFRPEDSYGSVIVVVPDADALYQAFAAGLRQAHGKLPVAGIPRILRPRKRYGTVRGFTIVDPGGNWLRFFRQGDTAPEEDPTEARGLAQIIDVAARLGDAAGNKSLALKTLESGLVRFGGSASAIDLARANLYLAELAVRTGNQELGQVSRAAAECVGLSDEERLALADEFAHVTELLEP